ncbi:MAG TPA: exopolysaccharide biosynthesis protein, partial [Fibrobacteria bacterium]|nr:exopolysaccharide biosynthesis protein [Fibrobacteria bacterium]
HGKMGSPMPATPLPRTTSGSSHADENGAVPFQGGESLAPGAEASPPGYWPDRRQSHEAHRLPHAVTFGHDQKSCSQLLSELMHRVPEEGMSLRGLIHSLGERGLLMACMVFCIPSMLPIPMPGISIPQGFIIGLIGLGLLLNRAPMLPERLLEFRLAHRSLFLILEKGASLFARIEKLSFPRLDILTRGFLIRTVNGTLLVAGSALLMAPFPIPFSNVLPAYAILFLAFGIMQRDGFLVIGSYVMLLFSIAYIAAVLFFGMAWLGRLFG